MLKKNSLQFRIFLSMILLVILAFVAITLVTIVQYKNQSKKYHNDRLARKEEQIKSQIQYVLAQTTYPVQTSYIPLIFRNEIYHIANIQNINFELYSLQGDLLKSSKVYLDWSSIDSQISFPILVTLAGNVDKRYVIKGNFEGKNFLSSYSYITDERFKPIAILKIPYFENDPFYETALRGSLYNLTAVYLLLLCIAIFLAYLVSKYITKSLKTIEQKLDQTRILKRNEKIILKNPSDEIGRLVCAYNSMVDEIEKSTMLLAKSERESAWKDMARQVAHEIKNPLTPMRLTVQSFERSFDANSPNAQQELKEFSETLLQQIDTLSNIASAFSAFTSMPAKQEEDLEIVSIIKRTVDIFNNSSLSFECKEEKIHAFLDKDQLIRIITNLVKNALQATKNVISAKVIVTLEIENNQIIIKVKDNGIGISKENQEKIFEPKFTTKTRGTGLGLAMVKNIVESNDGRIELHSIEGVGSEFTIFLPKSEKTI